MIVSVMRGWHSYSALRVKEGDKEGVNWPKGGLIRHTVRILLNGFPIKTTIDESYKLA